MHKARIFREFLGIEKRHASVLAELIKASLPHAVAHQRPSDEHGERWTTYHRIIGLTGTKSAIVTVGWIIKLEPAETPFLTSCYIEPEEQVRLAALV
jgi:hypothetical protein